MSQKRNMERSARQKRAQWRDTRGWLVLAAIFWALGDGGFKPALAGGPIAEPGWLQLETDLTVSREVLDTRWSSLVRPPSSPPDYSLASAQPALDWHDDSHTPGLIEVSPARLAAKEPEVAVRPQFALGGSSDSLRSWLRFAGIDATHCMAPLMRMHSSFADSSSHANVSVSARCSLH